MGCHKGEQIMEFNIPSPLKGEHEALHEGVARAHKVVGNIGDAARAVAQILHHML